MVKVCSTHGEMKIACKILVGTSERKRPLEISEWSWKDNTKYRPSRNRVRRWRLY